MTCREFKHTAASLTLWELTRNGDSEILAHTEKCEACSAWLRKQRTLAASMQSLQTRTAGLEAGPDVERALLRAFRQDTHQGKVPAFSDVAGRSGPSALAVTPLSTPVALRLSRFFEVGAYVAIAAALLVGVFLGLRLLRDQSRTPVQAQVVPRISPDGKTIVPAEDDVVEAASAANHASAATVTRRNSHAVRQPSTAVRKHTSEDAQTYADAGYTALMFCDPLSCAAETQVVRVELPPPAGAQSSQPQMADLVVGYDGVVRAMRIVN